MTYQERRRILIEYLKMKTECEDWHGVADAACDLREMDAVWKTETCLKLENNNEIYT